jgi:hypothetical protein
MIEPAESQPDSTRIIVSKGVRDELKGAFPNMTFAEAVTWLLARHKGSIGDVAAVANSKLWIKLDRLEEACSLLALTNVDMADGLRRQISGKLDVVRDASARLAKVAASNGRTGGPV